MHDSSTNSDKQDSWKDSNKVAQVCIAQMSREVGSALNTSWAHSYMLLESDKSDLTKEQLASRVSFHYNIEHARDLFKKYTAILRATTDTLYLVFKPVNIAEILENLSSDTITIDCSNELPTLEGDRSHLAQVIESLVYSYSLFNLGESRVISANIEDEVIAIKMSQVQESVPTIDTSSYPELFYSDCVVGQHNGQFALNYAGEELEIIIKLPVVQPENQGG